MPMTDAPNSSIRIAVALLLSFGTTVASGIDMAKIMSAFAVAFVCLTSGAFAQGAPPAPVPHDQIISGNPFGLIAGWYNAEYERRLTPSTTWGVSGSTWDFFDEFEYRTVSALVRFYPQGRALDGFFLGLRAGVHHVSGEDDVTREDEGGTVGGAGFELGYTWLLGANERVGISIGAGANRLFGGDLDGAQLTVPTIRLVNVGFAF